MSNTGSKARSSGALPEAARPASPACRGERRSVSAFRCRVWVQHARPEEQLTDDACKSLRESIARNGQHQAALGRPVADDPDCDVEIICGARRHAAALALGRDLLVDVRAITDHEAYVAMYEENAQRKDDCPYVQGQILRRALLSGTCSGQEALSSAFNLSHSRVSRLLAIAQLPSIIVAAFRAPHDIRESWGVRLYQLWKDQATTHALTTRARRLANKEQPSPARDIYTALTAGIGDTRATHGSRRSTPVCGANGAILFREQERTANILFVVSKTLLTPGCRATFREAMVHVLEAIEADVNSQRRQPGRPNRKIMLPVSPPTS